MGLIAGQATKIQHVIRCGQKERVREKEVLTGAEKLEPLCMVVET